MGWPRRESRRRGEELFRHDVDNFELHHNNVIRAPGGRMKKIRRGRSKYGHHGRTCGYGQNGALSRGRRSVNPGYEGGQAPLHITTPKLLPEHKAMMRVDPYTSITLRDLSVCQDGDDVDIQDLRLKGANVRDNTTKWKFARVKVKGKEKDEFTVKNLTVYAHAFEPPAREKIEDLGGRCIRLHDWSNLPIDPDYAKVSVPDFVKGEEAPAEEGEPPAEE